MKKDKINYENLNDTISVGKKILKLFYAFLIILVIVGLTFLFKTWNVFPILGTILKVMSPFFIGFIVAWLLNPLASLLTEKGMNRNMASVLAFILMLLVIYLFCLAVVPALITQLNDMVKMIPDYVLTINDKVNTFFTRLSDTINIDLSTVQNEFLNYLGEFAKNTATNAPTTVIEIVTSTITGIGSAAVGFIIGFYLLFNFNNASAHLISILPRKIKADTENLLSRISKVLYKFVNGTLLISFILFVFQLIGFSIIGLNAPVLFALFCAVTNIIPYIGPYIGGIPAVLVGYSQSPIIGTLVLIFIVVVQGLESNFLHPIVIGKKMDLHPVTIVISLLIFGYFFGIIGMIVATPVMAVIKILYEFFDEKYNFFGYTNTKSVKKEISKVTNQI